MSDSNSGDRDDEENDSNKMSKRNAQWGREILAMVAAARGRNRLRMFVATVGRVGDEEGRIGSKSAEPNWNNTADQGQAQSTHQILADFLLVVLPNSRQRLVPWCIGRGVGPTRYLGRMGGRHTDKHGVGRRG